MSRCLAAALLSTALAYPHRWLEQTDDVGGCGVLVSNRQGDSGMMGNGYRYVFPTTTSFINAVGTLGDELQPAEEAASWKASVHSDAYMQKDYAHNRGVVLLSPLHTAKQRSSGQPPPA